jgi:hypothetical protein
VRIEAREPLYLLNHQAISHRPNSPPHFGQASRTRAGHTRPYIFVAVNLGAATNKIITTIPASVPQISDGSPS